MGGRLAFQPDYLSDKHDWKSSVTGNRWVISRCFGASTTREIAEKKQPRREDNGKDTHDEKPDLFNLET